MTFAAEIYVDQHGTIHGASKTDQRGCKSQAGRTVRGQPVEYAGRWYGSQMGYAPFRACVADAARRAAERAA